MNNDAAGKKPDINENFQDIEKPNARLQALLDEYWENWKEICELEAAGAEVEDDDGKLRAAYGRENLLPARIAGARVATLADARAKGAFFVLRARTKGDAVDTTDPEGAALVASLISAGNKTGNIEAQYSDALLSISIKVGVSLDVLVAATQDMDPATFEAWRDLYLADTGYS